MSQEPGLNQATAPVGGDPVAPPPGQGTRIGAPVLLLRARQGRVTEFAAHPARSDDWGWAAYSPAVTVAWTPGTHHTMLTAAADLAGVIDQ